MHTLHTHHTVLAAGGSQPFFDWLLVAVTVFPVLVYVALLIASLISIVSSPLSRGPKVLWAIFTLVAPLAASIIWFFIGRREARLRATAAS
ncbi:PLD nuclease N-terminal domain-containing protein [Streptomyces sp. NPDC127108]|uniref:PLD nuclease N-terminal domain-containing protein n=1 Tax=Streptomyces sp. NPDC127108 TaxID=3345361 RepID=UPI00362A2EBC